MAFGKLLPIFPPDSKPPSRESLAMYGIFSKFPKTNIPKPVLERRAAFDRTGVLQTKSATTKIEKPFIVPFLPSSPASLSTPGVVVYPIRPAVSLHGKVIVYLHAGTYISGSIRSHGKFVSHIAEQAHRLLYFVEYSYVHPSFPSPSLFHCCRYFCAHFLPNDNAFSFHPFSLQTAIQSSCLCRIPNANHILHVFNRVSSQSSKLGVKIRVTKNKSLFNRIKSLFDVANLWIEIQFLYFHSSLLIRISLYEPTFLLLSSFYESNLTFTPNPSASLQICCQHLIAMKYISPSISVTSPSDSAQRLQSLKESVTSFPSMTGSWRWRNIAKKIYLW